MPGSCCFLAALMAAMALCAVPAAAATINPVVNDADDTADTTLNGICDADGGDQCTLRAAILEANANVPNVGQTHTISFSLGFGTALTPATAYASLNQPVSINGCSADPAATEPCITLTGTGGFNGLTLNSAPGIAIRGLAFGNFNAGLLTTENNSGAIIQNNYFGIDLAGGTSPNAVGVGLIGDGATLGGDAANQDNIISGNTQDGIRLAGDNNLVQGNLIGTTPASTPLPNGDDGIDIVNEVAEVPSGNLIGTDGAGQNEISFNGDSGIAIAGAGTVGNQVLRNFGRGNGNLFIDLGDDGAGNFPAGPNGGIQAPLIASATTASATGTGLPGARVRLFTRPDALLGGISGFAGEAVADASGNWVATLSGVSAGAIVAATQTTTPLGTSELSANAIATALPTPAPPATPAKKKCRKGFRLKKVRTKSGKKKKRCVRKKRRRS